MIEQAKLKRVYDYVISNKKTNVSRVQNRNDEMIEWVLVFELDNSHKEIGITQNGYWGIKLPYHFSILDKESSLLFFIVLLEHPIEDIERKLSSSLNKFMDLSKTNKVFPFLELVKFIFDYNSSSYWIDLAFKWYEQFTFSEKQVLKESIDKLVANNSISQKTRQKAKRELNSTPG